MAIIRCEECGKPKGKDGDYVQKTEPVGYPDTSSICGTDGCENPGLLWLKEKNAESYKAGQIVFDIPTKLLKIKVKKYAD